VLVKRKVGKVGKFTLQKWGERSCDEGKIENTWIHIAEKNVWRTQRTKEIIAVDMRSTQFSPSSTLQRFRPKS
jgi:hypothetical protein